MYEALNNDLAIRIISGMTTMFPLLRHSVATVIDNAGIKMKDIKMTEKHTRDG